MRHKSILLVIFILFQSSSVLSSTDVRIKSLKGQVTVRRGLEEMWKTANMEMTLKDIDTILAGENSEVVLELSDNATFTLGSNSVLDIGDLRRITKREMFLYIMALKIEKIDRSDKNDKIQIQNVSVVRAEKKSPGIKNSAKNVGIDFWEFELNGARALIQQRYFTNSVMKLYKIINHYGDEQNPGLIHLYLGQSFEFLNESGRAVDEYKKSIELVDQSACQRKECKARVLLCEEAILRIQSKNKNE